MDDQLCRDEAHMNEVSLFRTGVPARQSRRAGRVLDDLGIEGLVRQTAIDIQTDVALAKLDALTSVTGSGMAAVTRVAQAQVAMEQLNPQASGRLNLIADWHAMAVVEELDRHAL